MSSDPVHAGWHCTRGCSRGVLHTGSDYAAAAFSLRGEVANPMPIGSQFRKRCFFAHTLLRRSPSQVCEAAHDMPGLTCMCTLLPSQRHILPWNTESALGAANALHRTHVAHIASSSCLLVNSDTLPHAGTPQTSPAASFLMQTHTWIYSSACRQPHNAARLHSRAALGMALQHDCSGLRAGCWPLEALGSPMPCT